MPLYYAKIIDYFSVTGNISAVFIHKWKGEELVNKLGNDSKVFVHITIAGQQPSRTANINR